MRGRTQHQGQPPGFWVVGKTGLCAERKQGQGRAAEGLALTTLALVLLVWVPPQTM